MIRLDIQGYCDACRDFTPDVTNPYNLVGSDGTVIQSDTIVRCSYAKRCEAIKRYLLKRIDEKEGDEK